MPTSVLRHFPCRISRQVWLHIPVLLLWLVVPMDGVAPKGSCALCIIGPHWAPLGPIVSFICVSTVSSTKEFWPRSQFGPNFR